jgi:hypothetical protein
MLESITGLTYRLQYIYIVLYIHALVTVSVVVVGVRSKLDLRGQQGQNLARRHDKDRRHQQNRRKASTEGLDRPVLCHITRHDGEDHPRE